MDKIALTIAAIALSLHGLMEIAPLLFAFRPRPDAQMRGKGIPTFIFEPLQNNMKMTVLVGMIFGFMRLVAALGIGLNYLWGLVLGIAISLVTLIIMTLYLPMGILDGILSGITLLSLVIAYWGGQPILRVP